MVRCEESDGSGSHWLTAVLLNEGLYPWKTLHECATRTANIDDTERCAKNCQRARKLILTCRMEPNERVPFFPYFPAIRPDNLVCLLFIVSSAFDRRMFGCLEHFGVVSFPAPVPRGRMPCDAFSGCLIGVRRHKMWTLKFRTGQEIDDVPFMIENSESVRGCSWIGIFMSPRLARACYD